MRLKLITTFLSICLFIATVPILAKNITLHYEPKVVTLTGIVKLKTFPGPPNYESIDEGDDEESCPYLILKHPIDVIKEAGNNNPAYVEDEPEKNLKIIQIATDENANWSDKYIGKRVNVTGHLYHAMTGHHHTKVLIYATHFEMAQ